MGIGGVLLRCSTPQDLPKKVTLRLTYPQEIPKYPDLTVQAVVRWTRLRSLDSTQFVGVEFKNTKALGTSWVKAKTKDIGFESFNLRDQRKSLRLACKIPATIELVGGWTMRASIRNLGLGGFFVALLKPIRAGATIIVKLDDGLELPRTTYSAVIRHQQHPDPSSPYGYGCAFKDLKDSQLQELRAYLLKAQGKQWESLEDSDEDIHQDLIDMNNLSTAEPKLPEEGSLQEEARLQEERESEDPDTVEESS